MSETHRLIGSLVVWIQKGKVHVNQEEEGADGSINGNGSSNMKVYDKVGGPTLEVGNSSHAIVFEQVVGVGVVASKVQRFLQCKFLLTGVPTSNFAYLQTNHIYLNAYIYMFVYMCVVSFPRLRAAAVMV